MLTTLFGEHSSKYIVWVYLIFESDLLNKTFTIHCTLNGTTTFSITMTPTIKSFNTTPGIKTLTVMTLSMITFSIATLRIKALY